MVKCLECGFESERLQWTHFKYNCTGRFKNGVEYKAAYPGAKIISDTLSKNTAVTLANLIKKYGQEEGELRWEEYRRKQADTNSYEYKKEKYGWSKEEFDEYNSSRAQTLEKMIARHGEEIGAKKWEDYCLRQAYTNTKAYFVEKYGEEIGTNKYLEVNKKKNIPANPSLLSEHLHISEEEATQIIISRKSTYYCSNLETEFTSMLEAAIGFLLEHTSKKSPFGKWSSYLNSYVVYDICHKNCIIEFNGDYWHANPKIYAETAIIRGSKAVDIWQKDMLKLKTATDLGFKVLSVWEQEFKSNKALTIERVVKWMSLELK